MLLLDALAEQKIEAALKAGELSNLPGEGRPVPAEDWALVPEEERAAYRLLKNAGYLPPELELHREAVGLALQLATQDIAHPDFRAGADRLSRINLYLAEVGKPQLMVPLEYLERLAGHL